MRGIGQLQNNESIPISDEQIEIDVENEINIIRNLMNSNRYQDLLA